VERPIDVATGDLIVGGLRIGPGLSRSAFLRSPHGDRSTAISGADPWRRFALITEVAGTRFDLQVQFREEYLESFDLSDREPPFSWSDYSEEGEQLRKRRHDEWLSQALGPARSYRYPWGEIESIVDERGGPSAIIINDTRCSFCGRLPAEAAPLKGARYFYICEPCLLEAREAWDRGLEEGSWGSWWIRRGGGCRFCAGLGLVFERGGNRICERCLQGFSSRLPRP
jgi:hypothetical protein